MATKPITPVNNIQAIRAAAKALREQSRAPGAPTAGLGFLPSLGAGFGDIVNGFGDAKDAYQLRRAERQ